MTLLARIAVVVAVTIGVLFTLRASQAANESEATRLVDKFKCVHHYEGAWTSNTGNGYFGGFQMDRTFERTYGGEFLRVFGDANHWPPALQLAVAIRAWTHRGFRPWPNSARLCGLLP
jgi:hypothetical protein